MRDDLPDAMIGFFGKLPSRGDFVRSGLPGDFVAAWDDWVQRMLTRTQEVLGEQWEPAWLTAPVWRFAMAPGACGAGAALGVMVPSVDSIGRYFPLTVAVVLPAIVNAVDAPDLHERLEQVAREALSGQLSPDDLTIHVEAALDTGVASDPSDLEPGWWTEGAPSFAPVFCRIAGLPDVDFCVRLLVEAEPEP